MKHFFDTSVLVAALERGHPHHERAAPKLQSVIDGEVTGFMGIHSMAETYVALTRIPVVPRIRPEDVLQVIERKLLPYIEVVRLEVEDYLTVLKDLAAGGIVGASIYDALLLRCAWKCGADVVHTFNLKDYLRVSPPEMRDKILQP